MSNNITYQNINKIYFLGIGGIGMSALARYFHANGKTVKGYDKTPSPLTEKLVAEGIEICFEDDINLLDKETDLVVYTPAIPKDSKQFNWFVENKYEVRKRSYVLGLITQDTFCIAVAGSHGKTTVSSMIAHILNETIGCTAFLGGIVNNFQSNYINSNNEIVVVEADEYDRSFMTLKPNITVITSVDTDHLDIYGSLENIVKEFRDFARLLDKNGVLIEHSSIEHLDLNTEVSSLSYGLEEGQIEIITYDIENGKYYFDVDFFFEEILGFELALPGTHNMENALAAIAVAKSMDIKNEDIIKALASFKGIYRRFEKRVETDNIVYIDDYAHHPNEVKALLSSINEMYPESEVTAVFQPHLFSRTKDLATEFAEQLSMADCVVLLPIYPARELPMEGVSSSLILELVTKSNKQIVEKENLLNFIKNNIKPNQKQVILTIGAGDIDRFVNPITDLISEIK